MNVISPITINTELPEKMQCIWQPMRYKVFWGGRGGGKSWGVARTLVGLAASKKLRILCSREFQNSIKESVHQLIEKQIGELDLRSHFDVQRDTVLCPSTGSEFIFIGMHLNPDKVKSYEDVDVCWVEEADKVTRTSWKALTPTIRKPAPGGPFGAGAEIWVTFNPHLAEDETYQRFVVKPRRNSFVVNINYFDNPWFWANKNLVEEMEQDREEDTDNYLHVWEGHCQEILEGAVFAEELRECRAQKRITSVPYDRTAGVDVIFDLGRADHTSMWFKQTVAWEQHFIDFYQNKHKFIDHYIEVMQKKGYVIDTVWLPHDGKAKRLGAKMTIEEQIRAKGYFVRIIPVASVSDKLNAGRTIFPNSWFDEAKCVDGLHSLRHYKYEVDNKNDPLHPKYSQNPLHDWASDAADAFCYSGFASQLGKARRAVVDGVLQPKRLLSPKEWFRPVGSTGWMG